MQEAKASAFGDVSPGSDEKIVEGKNCKFRNRSEGREYRKNKQGRTPLNCESGP